ncbi:hypothetical protein EPD60_12015 [Flaviaesturariibacter flavus]|uniref:Uncharacterized protein n=1 Tax=Flaviaesturariibacter flavus TaxID=2502780 RepID=A0A4V2NVK2_9BACT|nr:hypothetical protein [Flaviaesturariibacter flavus]TCJ13812.1 hypothetical protein EPD60_12015 [Flaviaesturariibacter flavus]
MFRTSCTYLVFVMCARSVAEDRRARGTLPRRRRFRPGQLVFFASVGATTQWHKDDEVLGSYIGIYGLNAGKITARAAGKRRGQKLQQKIESVEVPHGETGGILACGRLQTMMMARPPSLNWI